MKKVAYHKEHYKCFFKKVYSICLDAKKTGDVYNGHQDDGDFSGCAERNLISCLGLNLFFQQVLLLLCYILGKKSIKAIFIMEEREIVWKGWKFIWKTKGKHHSWILLPRTTLLTLVFSFFFLLWGYMLYIPYHIFLSDLIHQNMSTYHVPLVGYPNLFNYAPC